MSLNNQRKNLTIHLRTNSPDNIYQYANSKNEVKKCKEYSYTKCND